MKPDIMTKLSKMSKGELLILVRERMPAYLSDSDIRYAQAFCLRKRANKLIDEALAEQSANLGKRENRDKFIAAGLKFDRDMALSDRADRIQFAKTGGRL